MEQGFFIRLRDKIDKFSLERFVCYSAIAMAFLYLLRVSWFRWGGLMIDTFREVLIPGRILGGAVLYKDIAYECGIFPMYFIAGLFKLFGVSLGVLAFYGIAVTALTTVLFYRIARLFMPRVLSSFVAINFLFVFAFPNHTYNGIFNFILPYSTASVMFAFFGTLAAYGLLKFIFSAKPRYLALWSTAVGMMFLTRPFLFIFALPFFVLLAIVYCFFAERGRRDKEMFLASLLAPIAVAGLIYAVFFKLTGSFPWFIENLSYLLQAGATSYHVSIMGIDNFKINALNILISLSAQVFAALVIAMVLKGLFSLGEVEDRDWQIFLGVFTAFAVVVVFLPIFLTMQYFPLCAVALLICVRAFYEIIWRRNFNYGFALFALTMLAMAVMARMLFLPNVLAHGFCFAALASVIYFIFFFTVLFDFFEGFLKNIPKVLYQAVLLCAFSLLTFYNWQHSAMLYRARELTMKLGRTSVNFIPDDMHVKTIYAINYLREHTPPNSTVVGLPETSAINFLSGRQSPVRHTNFLPTLFSWLGDDAVIKMFSEHMPDYIVLSARSTVDYGKAGLGIDYAQKFYKWITDHYETVQCFGPYPFTAPEFGIAILKKKGI